MSSIIIVIIDIQINSDFFLYVFLNQIFGPTHPTTLRTKSVIDEPAFRIIAEEMELEQGKSS